MKYFTYTDREGYLDDNDERIFPMQCNELLHHDQIRNMLSILKKPQEAYATMQDYDEDGEIIGCPMFFDIDSESLLDAYNEMRELVQELRDEWEVEPLVWFSGGKGFHVVAPRYIRHPRCHEIMKLIADELGFDVDYAVYRTRSMWRCNKTWNVKGEKYKVVADVRATLQQILKHAENEPNPEERDPMEFKDLDIASLIPRLPDRSAVALEIGDGDFAKDFKPCMRTIWEMEAPPDGQRHKFLHLMARHCFRSGMEISEAIEMFESHPFWKTVKRRDYEKVINSVYRSGHALIGCSSGSDADLLRPYCGIVCSFNKELSILDLINMENK